MTKTICVVGSGGREHALAEVLGRSAEVVVTPGSPAIPGSIAVDPIDVSADLFVIGPEAPLVDGLADRLRAQGKLVFGPGAAGARLEGSKAWMKDVLVRAGVPTAAHATFSSLKPALSYLDSMSGVYVIKTDGLAAGKGVFITEDLDEARHAVSSYLSGDAFGDAGRRIVIEEGLTGPELSVLAICDGTKAVALAPAQDFKRLSVGDSGPNTGGMGAYSPVPAASDDLVSTIMRDAVEPTLETLRAMGIDYRGVLYAGLMLTPDGPKLLEYNVRFGDPETQVVLPRLTSDLVQLLSEAAAGDLRSTPTFGAEAMVTVVCAAKGYPVAPLKGAIIEGIDEARSIDGVSVFCAAVGVDSSGAMVVDGGRVLNVVGRGASVGEARAKALAGVSKISWPGMQFRTDIAATAEQIIDLTMAESALTNEEVAR